MARRAETFARLEVTETATGKVASVDLAADIRNEKPVALSVGPVLAESDAVGSKVAAVFSRGYARDYLDLAGILASGRYTRDQLIAMARSVDTGFTTQWFAEALTGVDRFSDDEFSRYGVSADQIAAVRQAMRSWSAELTERVPTRRDRATRSPNRSPWSDPHTTPEYDYQPPEPEGPSL